LYHLFRHPVNTKPRGYRIPKSNEKTPATGDFEKQLQRKTVPR
jgi:hypothetical protein